MTGFLDVEQSLTGRRWIGPEAETLRLAEALMQRADLSPGLAHILARRGVAPEGWRAFWHLRCAI